MVPAPDERITNLGSASSGQIRNTSTDQIKLSEDQIVEFEEEYGFQRIFWTESIISLSSFCVYMYFFYKYYDQREVITAGTALFSLLLCILFTADCHQLWTRPYRRVVKRQDLSAGRQSERSAKLDKNQLTAPVAPHAIDRILWPEATWVAVSTLFCVYSIITVPFYAQWRTWAFGLLVAVTGGIGISGGMHRLWSHRCYKANLPLQTLLMLFQTAVPQFKIETWVQNHRMHHKYSDTDIDPHNARRGFFYSHLGWIITTQHPHFRSKLQTLNMADIKENPVIQFQSRNYYTLVAIFSVLLPTVIPHYFWNESLTNAFTICFALKFFAITHITSLVNSACHLWGYRMYDTNLLPAHTPGIDLLMFGENHHNFHHVFPWDYSLNEFESFFNVTKGFIDFMALIGWAWDRKSVSRSEIRKRQARTGLTCQVTH